jgi:L-lactate dehydrogenase complex protein LldE
MRIGLFIPCYVDQLRPQVGIAAVRLLERFGVDVDFPREQTCCGQPLISAGGRQPARPLAERFVDVFGAYDHVVCPSASCVATVTKRYREMLPASDRLERVVASTHELCAFLTEVVGVEALPGRFPHRVGLHASCHGLRALRHGAASERVLEPAPDPARALLSLLDGIELVELTRPDECCGFGGVFAVDEAAVSCAMGRDRLRDHSSARTEVLTSTDASCLIHLDGLARRERLPLRALHVAELLDEALA